MRSLFASERGLSAELAAVCAVPILLLGIVVGLRLTGQAQRQARADVVQDARISAAVPLVAPLGGDRTPSPVTGVDDQRALDSLVALARRTAKIDRVIVRDASGRTIFSDDHRLIGKTFGVGPDLRAALKGMTSHRKLQRSDQPPYSNLGNEMVIWTPLEPSGSAPVLELWVPYSAVDARAAKLRGRALTILALALLVLWAGVFVVVARTARHLLGHLRQREGQALSDPLTGLPNRAAFQEAVEGALTSTGRRKVGGVLMLMDLDRFKDVNDTLGHHNGDLLLQRIGSRLASVLQNNATVARLGGDEFAILLRDTTDRQAVIPIVRRVLKVLEEPVNVGGLSLQVEASIGIAVFPTHGQTIDQVMRAADVAMYVAKEQHSGYEFYDPAQHERRHDAARLALVGELRRAMDAAELVLYFQPKLDLNTGAAAGVEALARWHHPERGMLSPGEFIPLAEKSNLLRPMTLYLIDTALRQSAEWREQGVDVPISVNLSMQSLVDTRLGDDVAQLLQAWEIPPRRLEIEVTESAVMSDPRRAETILNRLSDMGVRLSIDDYGTGYSSLAIIQQLPISAIKIDKSFVMGMDDDAGNATIVQSTIQLGHDLGLEVVAEGVETETAYDRLRHLGCDQAQGYFLSQPLPADRAKVWLESFAPQAAHRDAPDGSLAGWKPTPQPDAAASKP